MTKQKLPPIPSVQAKGFLNNLDADLQQKLKNGIEKICTDSSFPFFGTPYLQFWIDEYRILFRWISDIQIVVWRISNGNHIFVDRDSAIKDVGNDEDFFAEASMLVNAMAEFFDETERRHFIEILRVFLRVSHVPCGLITASDRAKEKQESRARDEARVDMAEDFQNGFFSRLDHSKVKIVRRRRAA